MRLRFCQAAAAFWVFCVATPVPAEPFTAAYHHPQRTIDENAPIPEREAALVRQVEQARAMGIRILMPYTSNTSGVAHYPSEVFPERRYGEWDPIQVIVDAARERGMKVYPSVPVLSCGHEEPDGILKAHPEWAVRNEAGKPLGYISPGHPDARAFIVDALRELVDRYGVDGILLDYLRYPNRVTRLDADSEARFLSETGQDKIDPAARGDSPWQVFREAQLTTLMKEIDTALPDTTLAIYTWGPHVSDGHNVGQNWAHWVAEGYLDIVNVSGYCYPDNYGGDYMEVFWERLSGAKALLDEAGNHAQATFCLGIVTSHGRIHEAGAIERYLTAARKTGMKGVAVFTANTLTEYHDAVIEADYFGAFEAAVAE